MHHFPCIKASLQKLLKFVQFFMGNIFLNTKKKAKSKSKLSTPQRHLFSNVNKKNLSFFFSLTFRAPYFPHFHN